MRAIVLFLALSLLPVLPAWAETPEREVRAVITAYQDALADRNIAHIEKAVGHDVVSIENGSRRQGWEEFRDRRLMPEFAHPAPPTRWEIVKLSASGDMAWAYTKSLLASSHKGDAVVWTVFVLERHGKEWKIVLVDRTSSHSVTAASKPPRH
jgi:ketosteroid isomerase-like protein